MITPSSPRRERPRASVGWARDEHTYGLRGRGSRAGEVRTGVLCARVRGSYAGGRRRTAAREDERQPIKECGEAGAGRRVRWVAGRWRGDRRPECR